MQCKRNCRNRWNTKISDCKNTCKLNVQQKCNEDSKCSSGVCAAWKYVPGSPKRCCRVDDPPFVTDPTGKRYCTRQKSGANCFTDFMCRSQVCNPPDVEKTGVRRCKCNNNTDCGSKVCVKGSCREQKQKDYAPCTTDSQCQSGACAERHIGKEKGCCPTGTYFFQSDNIKVCGGQPDNKPCFIKTMCRGNFCIDGRCRSNNN